MTVLHINLLVIHTDDGDTVYLPFVGDTIRASEHAYETLGYDITIAGVITDLPVGDYRVP